MTYMNLVRRTHVLCAVAALTVLAVSASATSLHAASSASTIYVSADGNDAADGLTMATAVLTPEQGRKLAGFKGPGATIMFAGRFVLARPLVLDASNKQLSLASAPGSKAMFVAAPGTKMGIIVQNADGVRITGLALSGFSEDGISVRNSRNVTVTRNEISETMSSAWSQGAIHFTGQVPGARITDNVVTGADYAGIIVDTDARSDVSKVRISGNRVTDTCRRVNDCGAIYINDRSRKSRGIIIDRNVVSGFSGDRVSGRGIYVDDWASYATVTNNTLAGPGTYAFQIHGGHDVLFSGNRVDMRQIRQFVLYQSVEPTSWSAMRRNRIGQNCFLGQPPETKQLITPQLETLPAGRPRISAQAACSGQAK